jgi:hypothetical protein
MWSWKRNSFYINISCYTIIMRLYSFCSVFYFCFTLLIRFFRSVVYQVFVLLFSSSLVNWLELCVSFDLNVRRSLWKSTFDGKLTRIGCKIDAISRHPPHCLWKRGTFWKILTNNGLSEKMVLVLFSSNKERLHQATNLSKDFHRQRTFQKVDFSRNLVQTRRDFIKRRTSRKTSTGYEPGRRGKGIAYVLIIFQSLLSRNYLRLGNHMGMAKHFPLKVQQINGTTNFVSVTNRQWYNWKIW